MTHELKTLPTYWDAIQRGEKTFEVRRNDRGFQKGDELRLMRHNGMHSAPLLPPGEYSVYEQHYILRRKITYILAGGQFGIEPGFVVMALAEVPRES